MIVGRQAFERQQVRELAVAVELRVARHAAYATPATGSTPSDSVPPGSRDSTIDRSRATARRAPAYVGLDRQLAAAAVDEHGELDALGTAEIEQLVDRGAHAAAGVEHVVDEHDRRAGDVERQRRALACSASGPTARSRRGNTRRR